MSDQQNQNPQQPTRQVQDLYISCGGYRDAAALVDDIEEALKHEGVPFAVLGYGTTSKAHTGFIVVECYRPLPGAVLDMLKAEQAITDYVTYSAPSIAQEAQAIVAAAMTSQEKQQQAQASDLLGPPNPPAAFLLVGEPAPLLRPNDERWISRALGAEGAGILIYEEGKKLLFMPADEAIAALMFMTSEVKHLLPHTHPELSARHQQVIEAIRSYWWTQELGTQTQEPDREAQQ